MAAPSICPACEATGARLFITHRGMDLLECASCRLVFMAEMPTGEDLRAAFDDGGENAMAEVHAKAASKMRRLRRRALARYARGPGRFLDVGADAGFMTEAMRELGFDSHGVEPHPPAVAYAREHYPKNSYHQTFMEAFEPGGLTFSAVYCSEVIEHSPDIDAFIIAIRRVMEPGAVLYLTTPDIGHWRRPRDLTSWDGFKPPSHCVYFNPRALVRFLEKHGFRILRRRLAFKPGIKLIAARGRGAKDKGRGL
ncbi:MAG: class I SAM-dependent methyltransferase [Proteobacteria bacterium]|nr:class I SAM-dependent methyltransferase [Pseudomonadota bacterium]